MRAASHGRPSYERVTVPLTSLSHGAGCGCKLPAASLRGIVGALPPVTDPRVLVSAEGSDDAAVVQLSDSLAIVQTADFFTPIVDDPYTFGRIAATNALSDVYAMGGRPVSALNLVAFPLETLGADVLGEILRGGADAVGAAGAPGGGGGGGWGGRLGGRRALDRRPGAEVRAGGGGSRQSGCGAHERGRTGR